MPQLPPHKVEASKPGGGGLSLALWLALGLLPGLGLGAVAGRSFFAGPGHGAKGEAARNAVVTYGELDPGGEGEATSSTRGKRGSSLGAKPIQGGLYENLHAAAAGMTQDQRMEELKRMLAEDTRPDRQLYNYRNMQNNGIDRQLQYMALIQKEDLPLLKELLDNMPPNQMSGGAYTMRNGCATAWAMLDPQGLEEWVTSKMGKDRSGSSYYEANVLAGYWLSLDSETAWSKAASLDKSTGKLNEANSQWIQRLMGKFIKENAQLAYQRAQTLQNRGLRRVALTSVLSDMAKNDLAKAMEMAGQQESVMEANKLESSVLNSFANSTSRFQEAADHVIRHGSQYTRESTFSNMMYNWSRKDMEGMKKWMEENREAVADLQLEQRYGSYFTRSEDPETLIKKAQETEDEQSRRERLGSAYNALMERRPEEALSRLKSMDAKTAEIVAPRLLSRLSSYDPERAASLVSTLPEPAQANALGNIFSTWMNQNPEAASAWLDKQPAGAAKDRGIEHLVNDQSRNDPETAALWALQISMEDKQRNSLTSVIYQWGEKSPEAARDWVQSQNIPDKTRQELLQNLESRINAKAAKR